MSGYKPKKSKKSTGRFRSLLEKNFASYMKKLGIDFLYEKIKLPYTVPAKERTYTPDFVIDPGSRRRIKKVLTPEELHGKLIIETKGRLTRSDQNKMLWVKERHPDLDIRFVFPNDRILDKRKKGRDGGKYRYSDWCIDNGYRFYIGTEPPKKWFITSGPKED